MAPNSSYAHRILPWRLKNSDCTGKLLVSVSLIKFYNSTFWVMGGLGEKVEVYKGPRRHYARRKIPQHVFAMDQEALSS